MIELSAHPAARVFPDRTKRHGSGFLWLSGFLAGCFLFLLTGPARAIEGDTLRPFVDASIGYDSNLFRFASDAQAQALLRAPIQAITYQRYGAGVDADWKQGRQQVTAHLAANKTSFSRYSSLLDYTGQDLKGEWKWQLGNRWSGLLSASRNRTLSPYNNIAGTTASNVSTDDNQAFQADYWFHADWRARFRLDQNDRQYSAAPRKPSDSNRRTATLGLYRQGGTVERLGVELLDIQGEFPNRPLLPALDNRSDEQALRLVGSWAISGMTNLSGFVGYAQRTHPNVSNHDFSGLEWRLAGRWLPTGKTQFEATLSRDIRDSEATNVNYEVADGLNLTAAWQVLPKTRLVGQGSYERIIYEGNTRKDDVLSASLSANHEAWRGGELAVGVQHSRRGSNIALLEYNTNMLFVSANLKF